MPQHDCYWVSVERVRQLLIRGTQRFSIVTQNRRKMIELTVVPQPREVLVIRVPRRVGLVIIAHGLQVRSTFQRRTLTCTQSIRDGRDWYSIQDCNGVASAIESTQSSALKSYCERVNVPFTGSENGRSIFGFYQDNLQTLLKSIYEEQTLECGRTVRALCPVDSSQKLRLAFLPGENPEPYLRAERVRPSEARSSKSCCNRPSAAKTVNKRADKRTVSHARGHGASRQRRRHLHVQNLTAEDSTLRDSPAIERSSVNQYQLESLNSGRGVDREYPLLDLPSDQFMN